MKAQDTVTGKGRAQGEKLRARATIIGGGRAQGEERGGDGRTFNKEMKSTRVRAKHKKMHMT